MSSAYRMFLVYLHLFHNIQELKITLKMKNQEEGNCDLINKLSNKFTILFSSKVTSSTPTNNFFIFIYFMLIKILSLIAKHYFSRTTLFNQHNFMTGINLKYAS